MVLRGVAGRLIHLLLCVLCVILPLPLSLPSHSNVIAEVAYFISACIVVGGFGKLLYWHVLTYLLIRSFMLLAGLYGHTHCACIPACITTSIVVSHCCLGDGCVQRAQSSKESAIHLPQVEVAHCVANLWWQSGLEVASCSTVQCVLAQPLEGMQPHHHFQSLSCT